MSGSVLCNDPLVISEQAYSCAVSNSMPKRGFADLPLLSIRLIHSSESGGKQLPVASIFRSVSVLQYRQTVHLLSVSKGLEQTGANHLIVLQAIDENRLDRSEPSPTSSPEAETSGTGKPEESRGLHGSPNIKAFQHLIDSPNPEPPRHWRDYRQHGESEHPAGDPSESSTNTGNSITRGSGSESGLESPTLADVVVTGRAGYG